jgi:hypothetical protein
VVVIMSRRSFDTRLRQSAYRNERDVPDPRAEDETKRRTWLSECQKRPCVQAGADGRTCNAELGTGAELERSCSHH